MGDDEDRFYDSRGFAKWWKDAESIWDANRSSDRFSLAERVDFHGGLSRQFPIPRYRVVYNKSVMYLNAAVVIDRRALIDHQLYWAEARSLDEARYITAVLNSTVVVSAVRHLQARGEHNPRHFDKLPLDLPIPAFNPSTPSHMKLVALAKRAERLVRAEALDDSRFELHRKRLRGILSGRGITSDLDSLVKEVMDY